MIDFGDSLKPSVDNLVKQIEEKENFVYTFKDSEKDFNEIISKVSKIYSNPPFSDSYKRNQLSKLRKIPKSLKNAFLLGKSSIIEVKKIGDLNLNWNPLENIIKNQCDVIEDVSEKYLDTFYNSWRRKIKVKGKIDVKYNYSLDELLKTPSNFKNFDPTFKGKDIREYVSNIEPYNKELEKNIEILESLHKISKKIESKIDHSEFKNRIEYLQDKLKRDANILRNAGIILLREKSEDFEKEFSDFIKSSRSRMTTEKIVSIAKKAKVDEGKRIITDLVHPKTNQLIETKIKEGLNLIEAGEYNSARSIFDEVIIEDNRNPKAHYYIAVDHLRRSKSSHPKHENLKSWYNSNLKKALNEFEKAREFSVGESKEHQSKIYSLLAYSKFLREYKVRNRKEKMKELTSLFNKAINLSDDGVSHFIKGKIKNHHYSFFKWAHPSALEDILSDLNEAKKKGIDDVELKSIFSPNEINYEKASLILKNDALWNREEAEGFALDWLKKDKNDEKSLFYISKIINKVDLELDIKDKTAKNLAKKALDIIQKKIEKHKDNPKNVKFLVNERYEQYYNHYAGFMSEKKRTKIIRTLYAMKNTGNFKKIRRI